MSKYTYTGEGNALTFDKEGNILYNGATKCKYIEIENTESIDPANNGIVPNIVTYEILDDKGNILISTTKLPAAPTGSINNIGLYKNSVSVPASGNTFTDGSVIFNTYYVSIEYSEYVKVIQLTIYSCGLIGPNKDIYYASNEQLNLTDIEKPPTPPTPPTNSNIKTIMDRNKLYIQKLNDSNSLLNFRNNISKPIQRFLEPEQLQRIFQKLPKNVSQELSQQMSKKQPQQQLLKQISQESPKQTSKKLPQQQPQLKNKNCCCKNKNKK